jgi:hypothetical protein
LIKVAGGFYGSIPVTISIWLHSGFSKRVTGSLTVSGPPTTSVPIRLPTIPRHELTHLARMGQLQPLLSGISDTQAFVSSDVSPGGGGRNAVRRNERSQCSGK